MEMMDQYTMIDGGVCAAKGFVANGLNCGLNKDPKKNDLALIYSESLCDAAGVYTQNKVKGAPVTVTKRHIEENNGKAKAIIGNSKNANTCNADGIEKAEKMCQLTAEKLGIDVKEVLVASTGVIGQILPIEPIESHIDALVEGLSRDKHLEAEWAMMTTDTFPKEVALSYEYEGKTIHIGGMAKGSGMIHPNMATTLNFVTTDANIDSKLLQQALSKMVKVTYNCLSVDGDQSTNDMLMILANGEAGNERITEEGEAYELFCNGLFIVLRNLTKLLAKDGEGASKLLECNVKGAPDLDTGIIIAKSVIDSALLKCAMFGEDANWGRILCAMGYADAEFDIDKVSVDLASEFGSVHVCENGSGVEFSEEEASKVLSSDEIMINIDLCQGDATAQAWGCDLTYDYVKINGDYRS